MKQLLLMRHGKSGWDLQVSDLDRSLTQNGVDDAYLVADEFSKQRIEFDFVYSSPANRAMHTALIFCRVNNCDLNRFQLSDSLYDFSGEQLNQFIRCLDNSYNTVALFGHNNAMSTIVSWLSEQGRVEIPTAGLSFLTSSVDKWEDFTSAQLSCQLFPKKLKQ